MTLTVCMKIRPRHDLRWMTTDVCEVIVLVKSNILF